MRFLCLYKPTAKEGGAPPSREHMAEMGKLVAEGMESGSLLATEGCMSSSKGARVQLSRGKYTVTDGPFTEAKELVAGMAIIRANPKEEAIADQGLPQNSRERRNRNSPGLRGS
jgi:hypothetical protein